MATTTVSNYWTATATATVAKCVTQGPKYGQCPICKVGLDDPEDFEFNYKIDLKNGVMMCCKCSKKVYETVDTCMNCENKAGGGDSVSSKWDQRTGRFTVLFCRRCPTE
jgi:hypothetical protein